MSYHSPPPHAQNLQLTHDTTISPHTTMDIPLELQIMVCRLLNKKELKIARLVCKSFERVAVAFLFNEVFLSTTRADFEVAQLTIRHFRRHIKTLVFSSVYYPFLCWTEFKTATRSQKAWSGRPKGRDKHLRYGYLNYCRLQQEQDQDIMTGVCLAQLCSALFSIPDLQRMIITDGGTLVSSEPSQIRGQGLWRIQKTCPVPACNLTDRGHLDYQLRPISGFKSRFADPWELSMLAVWTTKAVIKEIAVEPRIESPLLPIQNFSTSQQPYSLRNHFRNLTKIRLCLSFAGSGQGDYRFDESSFAGRNIARALSAATDLKSLYLEVAWHEYLRSTITRYQACLARCRFQGSDRSSFLTSSQRQMSYCVSSKLLQTSVN